MCPLLAALGCVQLLLIVKMYSHIEEPCSTTSSVSIALQCRVIRCAVQVKCSLRLSVSVKVSSMHSWSIFRYVHCYSFHVSCSHLLLPIILQSRSWHLSLHLLYIHCICKSLLWHFPHLPHPFLLPFKYTFQNIFMPQTLCHVIAPYPISSIHTFTLPQICGPYLMQLRT